MKRHERTVDAALAALVGAMVLCVGCDRQNQSATQSQQQADGSEATDQTDAAIDIRAAYRAVLDAAIGAQNKVVAEHGREPWGAAGVLRYPDFDAPAARPLLDEFGFDRDEFESELAISRSAAAALREAGVVETLAELTREAASLGNGAEIDLSGTLDRSARDAYRMLACLAVDAEVDGIGGDARAGGDDYATVIAGLDAMARAQLYDAGDDAAVSNLVLLRFTDGLVLDAIAAGHVSPGRALALLGSATVATDELRERYQDNLAAQLPTEILGAMANLWHATRDGRRVALAIEVYRGQNGGPPATIDALIPGVLPEAPRDPFATDGRYAYRRDATSPFGYVLYSVGPDGTDDGGVSNGRMPTPEPGTDQLLVPEG